MIKFNKYLLEGEKIIWTDQPKLFSFSNWFSFTSIVVQSVFALIFLLFGVSSLICLYLSSFYTGLLYTALFLVIIYLGFVFYCIRKKSTFYALTNKRAIIIIEKPLKKVSTFELKKSCNVSVQYGLRNTGSIIFNQNSHLGHDSYIYANRFSLDSIENVDDVYSLIIKNKKD